MHTRRSGQVKQQTDLVCAALRVGANGVEMFLNLPPPIMAKLRTPEARAMLAGFD